MQRIRHATKRRRGALIAVVVLLILGLVLGFASWGSNDYSSANQSGASIADQINSYQEYLAGAEAKYQAEQSYENANTLATGYQYLYQLYASASEEENAPDYQAPAQAAAANAAKYFKASCDLAPENLNDAGRARILANAGSMYYAAGDEDAANACFEEAAAAAPHDIEMAANYAGYLYATQGLSAAEDYLNTYIDGLPMGSSDVEQAKSLIERYQKLDSFNASLKGTSENQ
ncbi:MAG: hypothetical protein K6B40_06720 [Firmicutes bacterium]|nr:hypothetical protein [Bacillota bacterium]